MPEIRVKVNKLRSKAELWVFQRVGRLWFSRWRNKAILPFMRSAFFSAVSGSGRAAVPNFIQVLFQRIVVGALRHQSIMGNLFKLSLRVCVTYRCNLSCKACYVRGLQQEIGADEMTMENFARLVDFCPKNGWKRIRFLGGEPTVHPRFPEMLELCYRSGMEVSMPTNNLYDGKVAEKLDTRFVRDVAVNYSASFNIDKAGVDRFRRNLDHLRERGIPFSFSYILDASATEEQLEGLYRDLREYLPLYLRVSIELPAFSDQGAAFMPSEGRQFLFSRILGLLEQCARAYVPFYIYRPVPMCLFSTEERRRLEHYSKSIFYARCPLSCIKNGGGGLMVTVNPDLSTFPCASVFIKGPNILSFKDTREISHYFPAKLHQLMSAPLSEVCKGCSYHQRFLTAVNLREGETVTTLENKEMCQGGCLNLRCHDSSRHDCHQE